MVHLTSPIFSTYNIFSIKKSIVIIHIGADTALLLQGHMGQGEYESQQSYSNGVLYNERAQTAILRVEIKGGCYVVSYVRKRGPSC